MSNSYRLIEVCFDHCTELSSISLRIEFRLKVCYARRQPWLLVWLPTRIKTVSEGKYQGKIELNISSYNIIYLSTGLGSRQDWFRPVIALHMIQFSPCFDFLHHICPVGSTSRCFFKLFNFCLYMCRLWGFWR